MAKTVVITGMGLVSPLDSGKGIDNFWQNALMGKDTIKRVTIFDVSGYGCQIGSEIKGCYAQENSGNKWIQVAKLAFDNALKDASVMFTKNVGISLGTVLGGVLAGEDHWKSDIKKKNHKLPQDYSLSSAVNYFIENYGIKGSSITVSTACASGTDAIGIAYRKILMEKSDIMIAGGVDVLSEFAFSGFNILQALTKSKVRPFDKRRDGLALGEGAAFLVLEDEKKALKRNARIYGKIVGYASRGDANHLTGPDKDGKGLAAAIKASMDEAGLSLTQVDFINAHGTGTVYNDVMETKAVKSVFGKHSYSIAINSIKAMIGHSFGAAGAIEAITCILAIKEGIVPPTINYEEKDPECDLDYVPNNAKSMEINTSMSLSAGFGGQNAVVIFRKY